MKTWGKQGIMIALGGNLGDVQSAFDSACVMLQEHGLIIAKSKLYQTAALTADANSPAQADYLNAVVQLDTDLPAASLLQVLHEIEDQHGRKRLSHWASRTLDLDLLCYQDIILSSPELRLPHPELAKRLFVLQPLADIHPDWIHPVTQQPISAMIQHLIQHNSDLYKGKLWTSNTPK
ncbi:MAG: 2-amino-4-hydroxy-6-hydroxymethyldihydropteridine diphosphokinase [Mariprofundaceae bacterium]|nr:2-amino-4-hydroxy-6-hydroxymethyldihydropteridine diphosphokinase [Mariprofundaceae bacterium]